MCAKSSLVRSTIALLLFAIASPTIATAEDPSDFRGHVDLAAADLPPANVEIDLTDGIFGDLFGLLQGAITGASSALEDSDDDAVQFAS